MSVLLDLQKKQTENDKICTNFIKQINIIENIIKNKNDIFTVKVLEKQFLNTGIFKNWLDNFSYEKLCVFNQKGEHLFKIQLTFVIKVLFFFRYINLINENNLELINTIIENSEVFSRILYTDYEDFGNIIENCINYINKKETVSIFNYFSNSDNNISENKNTVEINNSVNINNKSDYKINLSDNNNNNDDKSSDSKNTVDNGISENSSPGEILETENINIKNVNEKKRKKYSKKDKGEKIKNTVHNIINNRIKNEELYNSLYKFNRNNIKLFSDIYDKYKVSKIIDDTEFNNIRLNFDKNPSRFLKICKIYYNIFHTPTLFDSKLLFLPYCFNEMSASEECLFLFKTSIEKHLKMNN